MSRERERETDELSETVQSNIVSSTSDSTIQSTATDPYRHIFLYYRTFLRQFDSDRINELLGLGLQDTYVSSSFMPYHSARERVQVEIERLRRLRNKPIQSNCVSNSNGWICTRRS